MKKTLINKLAGSAIAVLTALVCIGTANAAEVENEATFVEPYTQYTDVAESYWASDYIETVTELGLMTGYEDGSFRPNDTISEAEALTVFFRSTGYFAYGQVEGATPVDGVPVNQWYSEAVGGLQAVGLLNRSIAVNANISRQDFTVLAARTLGYTDIDESVAALCDDLYTDCAGMTLEQQYSAVVTNNENVVVGIGNKLFDCGDLSRAEAATIIYRMMQAIGVIDANDNNISDSDDTPVVDHDDDDDIPTPPAPPAPTPDVEVDEDGNDDVSAEDNITIDVVVSDGVVYDDVVDVGNADDVTIDVPVEKVDNIEVVDTVNPVVSVETEVETDNGDIFDDVVEVVENEQITVEVSASEVSQSIETVEIIAAPVITNACSVVIDGSVN